MWGRSSARVLGIAALGMSSFISSLTPTADATRLTLGERAEAHRKVEEVRWRNRLWPADNPGSKPPLSAAVPPGHFMARADDVMRRSEALRQFWHRPITARQLQAEMDRMARETRDPKRLREMFAALGNDPFLIAEVLARPILVDRLLHRWYSTDTRLHGELREQALEKLSSARTIRDLVDPEVDYEEQDLVLAETATELAEARSQGRHGYDLATWWTKVTELGREIGASLPARAGGAPSLPGPGSRDAASLGVLRASAARMLDRLPVGKIGILQEKAHAFQVRVVLDRWDMGLKVGTVTWRKRPLAAWWAENRESIARPADTGDRSQEGDYAFVLPEVNGSGCTPETWSTLTADAGEPFGRTGHTAIWTGAEMIVWGGLVNGQLSPTGARYSPATDTWSSMAAPAWLSDYSGGHTAVWTGAEMIIWDGMFGARYYPDADLWMTMDLLDPTGATARDGHTAVWDGTEMLIWGGVDGLGYGVLEGGRYNPSIDTWTPLPAGPNSPMGRFGHSAVFTGAEMIIWGGRECIHSSCGYRADGARLLPGTDTWVPIPSPPDFAARYLHEAVWTGTEMIVWGGRGGPPPNQQVSYSLPRDGARYQAASATWHPMTDVWWEEGGSLGSYPETETAVWTGNEILIWLGGGVGGRYVPLYDQWTPIQATDAPAARQAQTAIWTGTEMIVWGGHRQLQNGGFSGLTGISSAGGRYDPTTDSWVPTAGPGGTEPELRQNHTAVWTGTEMIVWGGTTTASVNSGGLYDPATASWQATAITDFTPSPRLEHTAVWTGTEMIVWGGASHLSSWTQDGALRSGGRYGPATDTWQATAVTDAPTARFAHTAVWTPWGMAVWGGKDDTTTGNLDSGAFYSPASDTWSPIPPSGTPRAGHAAVWTGHDMVVIGADDLAPLPAQRYLPTTGIWLPACGSEAFSYLYPAAIWTGEEVIAWGTDAGSGKRCVLPDTILPVAEPVFAPSDFPLGLYAHTAVWNGLEMLVHGGLVDRGGFGLEPGASGGRYSPATDSWAPGGISNRYFHTAVWTGRQMLVWGGYGTTQSGTGFCPCMPGSHEDLDGDGFGNPSSTSPDCDPPDGYVFNDDDCDDSEVTVYPGALEIQGDCLNNDCSSPSWPTSPDNPDRDQDGHGACEGDCDDANPNVYPDAPEINDGRENQCWSQEEQEDFYRIDELPGISLRLVPAPTCLASAPADDWCVTLTPLPGAVDYQIVRSLDRRFDSGCSSTVAAAAAPYLLDGTSPPTGQTFHYLARALSPHQGNWGDEMRNVPSPPHPTGEIWIDRTPRCAAATESDCRDTFDNDDDGLVDCLDVECQTEPGCEAAGEQTCDDGLDNDSDGAADCVDSDCDGVAGCQAGAERDCADVFDNDLDALVDCDDPDCDGIDGCEHSTERSCSDGLDNDHDGWTDCFDNDCDGIAGCESATELTCDDTVDNDGDGDVDCLDPDCQIAQYCPEFLCDDALDNDGDGWTDCFDGDCAALPLCAFVETVCSDWLDNDSDGFVDCRDADCDGTNGCQFGGESSCGDGYDNDGDLSVDCRDADCDGVGACEFPTELTCNDRLDNDADGYTDCADSNCSAAEDCEPGSEITCDDFFDNDGDGYADCEDADCSGIGICELPAELTCNDGLDNDGDGTADCRDVDCRCFPWCEYSLETICNDGFDNDGDGYADCADNDCDGIGLCEFPAELSCNDQFDNDGNGYVDCADSDCSNVPGCEPGSETTCNDGFDNDGDGLIDCLDLSCDGSSQCEIAVELTCNDRFDNDGDGYADCADTNCWAAAGCEPGNELTCEDSFDNDGDGATDCFDADCGDLSLCANVETICEDATDNDGDGYADCLDEDCDGVAGCQFGSESNCSDGFDNDGNGDADCRDQNCNGIDSCQFGAESDCSDGFDNDDDGDTDCLDEDCDGIGLCEFPAELSCNDQFDNDGHGDTDCLDEDCDGMGNCQFGIEVACEDGFDNDGDGSTDCYDVDCGGLPLCASIETICADATDNDDDGFADCLDADCDGVAGCESGSEVTCEDGFDNDGDGWTDCFDDDCSTFPLCAFVETVCDDGLDDDFDCRTDCEDGDCDGVGNCEYGAELTCNDGFDNDGDDLTDCADGNCWTTPGCEPGTELTCDDGFDNDGDGNADCGDADCDGIGICELGYEHTCDDGFDNDGDGMTDCADSNCSVFPACEYTERTCDDGFDNDGDGDTDWCDSDCGGPIQEICDGHDNDCDGLIDEDFGGLGSSCAAGIGACETAGIIVCSVDGSTVVCDAVPGTPAPVDEPDPEFLDANCDGIDGDLARALFVSTTGSDTTGSGAMENPFLTLSHALVEAASLAEVDQILVDRGFYQESVDLVDGIGVFGAYDSTDGWGRSAAYTTVLDAASAGATTAVTATGLSQPTVLEWLEIRSADSEIAGGSSYGILASGSNGLIVRHATISAGRGADGTAGSTPPGRGADGGDGALGESGCQMDPTGACGFCPAPQGGAAGIINPACVPLYPPGYALANGGRGGDAGYGTAQGSAGSASPGGALFGLGAPAGQGDWNPTTPYRGQSGAVGGTGSVGAPDEGGSFAAGGYVPSTGGTGTFGQHGQGGGGGGGGGGGSQGCPSYGGGGGGGGAGGCGGSGGGGGTSGGGSFAIYLWQSDATIDNCTLRTAGGGAGGDGGAGQPGGLGGNGGRVGTSGRGNVYGGTAQDDGSNGGSGGNGGAGGVGGTGGGGMGGPSVGVLTAGGSTPVLINSDGTGVGAGGTGGAPNGAPGVEGTTHP